MPTTIQLMELSVLVGFVPRGPNGAFTLERHENQSGYGERLLHFESMESTSRDGARRIVSNLQGPAERYNAMERTPVSRDRSHAHTLLRIATHTYSVFEALSRLPLIRPNRWLVWCGAGVLAAFFDIVDRLKTIYGMWSSTRFL
jgi:hypothetical protein